MIEIDGTTGSFPLTAGNSGAPIGQPGEYRKTATVLAAPLTFDSEITTPEGVMQAKAGDYLAQHQDGHAWPIKREIFEGTYEKA